MLTSAEVMAVERGDPVVKTLPTATSGDVALYGIIKVALPRDAYVRRVLDFPRSLQATTRRRLGIFGDPATAGDLRELEITSQDVNDLKKCQPGDCDFKLPATEMQRLRAEMDWSANGLQARVTAYARERFLQYVASYRARGDSALVVYDDRGNVHASEAFAALLGQSPYVRQSVPSLAHWLATYPRGHLADATEVLFWSEDVVPHLRPILSVTHLVVYTPPEIRGTALVATKQIYANHYFEAAFDLLSIVDSAPDSGQGTDSYLAVVRRFRFDNLPSGGILNLRGRALGGLRDRMTTDLRQEKFAAERSLEQP